MKKKLAYSLMVIVLTAVTAGAGLLVWVLTTQGGAVWLLGAISDRTSLVIVAQKASGSLAGGLKLENLSVKWQGGDAAINDFYLNLDMTSLLNRELRAEEIVIRGAKVTTERAEEKSAKEFRWPGVSGLPLAVSSGIDSLDISDAEYSSPGSSPFAIQRVSARVEWRMGTLSVEDLSAKMDNLAAEGSLSLNLAKPGADMNMELVRLNEDKSFERLLISADLSSGKGPEIITGPVKATALLNEARTVRMEGVFAVTARAVRVRRVSLTEENRPGRILLDGEAVFFPSPVSFAIKAEMEEIDLSSEIGREAVLSGNIAVDGTPDDYHGKFNVQSTGKKWLASDLAGEFHGNTKGAVIESIEGSWLGGNIQGEFEGEWEPVISFSGSLIAQNLDPSLIDPGWSGQINLDVSGSARFPDDASREISLEGRLNESVLMDHALTGEIDARVSGTSVDVRSLELHGKGFDLSGKGNISERLGLNISVSDLSSMVPDADGSLAADGWVRWRDEQLTGEFSGRGTGISWSDLKISEASMRGRAVSGGKEHFELAADARGIRIKGLSLSSLKLEGEGTPGSHKLSLELEKDAARVVTSLSGGYGEKAWSGRIMSLSGTDPAGNWELAGPVDLAVNTKEVSIARMNISGVKEERIELEASLHLRPFYGTIYGQWRELNLSRLDYWLEGMSLSGQSSGRIDISVPEHGETEMKGNTTMSGRFEMSGRSYGIQTADVNFSWNRRGLDAQIDLRLAKGGVLEASITSPDAASFTIPSRAGIEGKWHGLDVGLFTEPVSGLKMKGEIAGDFQGSVRDNTFDMQGGISLSGGAVQYSSERGRVSADVKNAAIVWQWKGETLAGSLLFALEDVGRAEGEFRLPVPARFPIASSPKSPLQASLMGTVREKGIITSLFPGIIQKGRGDLEFALTAGGTLERPVLGGTADLSEAGAYLPSGGINLERVSLSARLSGDKVLIDSFYAGSGEGHIEGSSVIVLDGWKVEKYEGKIKGDEFQTIYLPELRVTTSPDLTFEGDREKVAIRGTLSVPELRVFEKKGKGPIQPSQDVVLIDTPEREKSKGPPLSIDLGVNVILGQKVFVKAEGIDARLDGEVELISTTAEDIRGKGEIHVVEGSYKAYGVDLKIIRGRLIFAGGPVNEPSLDVFAARQTRDVLAGVLLSGTPQSPVVNLYSEPALSDTDILAYMVLGHPLGASSEQAGLVMRAAGALLSASESVVFRNQLQERLGIDTLEIQSGGGDVSESLITVGKYLTPNLYISYGRSIFTEANLVKMRYSFSKRLELETQVGEESGLDLYYKIDFK